MNLNKMTIEDVQVSGKKVLVRCDFNVPLDAEGNITDETRINAALPTIRYLLDHNAAVILCSHLGRPKGEFNMKYSLAPVAKRLTEKLGFEVKLAKDVVGPDAKRLAAEVEPGKAILLENVRFMPEEEKNDPEFAKELASMAELYVSDAFGTVHRAHASTAGVAAYLPAVAGFLIGKELKFLGDAVENPGASVPRDPRRRKGQGQDRRYPRAAGQGRRAADRRRYVLYIPRGDGRQGWSFPAGRGAH